MVANDVDDSFCMFRMWSVKNKQKQQKSEQQKSWRKSFDITYTCLQLDLLTHRPMWKWHTNTRSLWKLQCHKQYRAKWAINITYAYIFYSRTIVFRRCFHQRKKKKKRNTIQISVSVTHRHNVLTVREHCCLKFQFNGDCWLLWMCV